VTPRFDVWVCQGRVCRSAGGDAVSVAVGSAIAACGDGANARPLRGGCYGLCELGPNVVVRRFDSATADGADVNADGADVSADRLTISGARNETVYCGVAAADADDIVRAHVVDDAPLVRLTRVMRERELEPKTPIERRMRDLRVARAKATGTHGDE